MPGLGLRTHSSWDTLRGEKLNPPLFLFSIYFIALPFFSEVTSSQARCMSAEKNTMTTLVYDGLRPLTAKAGK